MTLFDLLDANMDALKGVGARAVAEARRDGVPAYYMDPALGEGLVRELPDGTRERLQRTDGKLVVIVRYGPREASRSLAAPRPTIGLASG